MVNLYSNNIKAPTNNYEFGFIRHALGKLNPFRDMVSRYNERNDLVRANTLQGYAGSIGEAAKAVASSLGTDTKLGKLADTLGSMAGSANKMLSKDIQDKENRGQLGIDKRKAELKDRNANLKRHMNDTKDQLDRINKLRASRGQSKVTMTEDQVAQRAQTKFDQEKVKKQNAIRDKKFASGAYVWDADKGNYINKHNGKVISNAAKDYLEKTYKVTFRNPAALNTTSGQYQAISGTNTTAAEQQSEKDLADLTRAMIRRENHRELKDIKKELKHLKPGTPEYDNAKLRKRDAKNKVITDADLQARLPEAKSLQQDKYASKELQDWIEKHYSLLSSPLLKRGEQLKNFSVEMAPNDPLILNPINYRRYLKEKEGRQTAKKGYLLSTIVGTGLAGVGAMLPGELGEGISKLGAATVAMAPALREGAGRSKEVGVTKQYKEKADKKLLNKYNRDLNNHLSNLMTYSFPEGGLVQTCLFDQWEDAQWADTQAEQRSQRDRDYQHDMNRGRNKGKLGAAVARGLGYLVKGWNKKGRQSLKDNYNKRIQRSDQNWEEDKKRVTDAFNAGERARVDALNQTKVGRIHRETTGQAIQGNYKSYPGSNNPAGQGNQGTNNRGNNQQGNPNNVNNGNQQGKKQKQRKQQQNNTQGQQPSQQQQQQRQPSQQQGQGQPQGQRNSQDKLAKARKAMDQYTNGKKFKSYSPEKQEAIRKGMERRVAKGQHFGGALDDMRNQKGMVKHHGNFSQIYIPSNFLGFVK